MNKFLSSRTISLLFLITVLIFFSLSLIFSLMEAGSVIAANPETVIVKQLVTADISMTVASIDLTLTPSISGLTGGTGNASTSINVITSNADGYAVTVQGVTKAGGLAAMTGDTTTGYFNDYASTSPVTWSYNSAGQASQFGFGITNGSLSSANGASGYSTCTGVESCWRRLATTSPITVVSVNTYTSGEGDTFFLKFRAHIPANSNPLVPQDWYTATTTVTAITL